MTSWFPAFCAPLSTHAFSVKDKIHAHNKKNIEIVITFTYLMKHMTTVIFLQTFILNHFSPADFPIELELSVTGSPASCSVH